MNSMDEIYNIRDNFIIVGLTGKYQSGCTFIAQKMSSEKEGVINQYRQYSKEISDKYGKIEKIHRGRSSVKEEDQGNADDANGSISSSSEKLYELAYKARKHEIASAFISKHYKEFSVIDFKIIVLAQVMSGIANGKNSAAENFVRDEMRKNKEKNGDCAKKPTYDEVQYMEPARKKENKEKIRRVVELLKERQADVKKFYIFAEQYGDDVKDAIQHFSCCFEDFLQRANQILCDISNIIGDEYQYELLFEEWASQIRALGAVYEYNVLDDSYRNSLLGNIDLRINRDNAFRLARTINNFIKIIKRNSDDGTRVIIDKLINPIEVLFLRERYSTFFLISVNPGEKRELKLRKLSKDEDDIVNGPATKEEKGSVSGALKKMFWGLLRTNIYECITLADIQITNNDEEADFVCKFAYYVALMLHPGLVQPSPMERIMQIAYTASLSSGCLSRQVGAVVTNQHYSVKAVGWNSTPQGQLPCTMRSFDALGDANTKYSTYFSSFESSDESFCKHCKSLHDEYTKIFQCESLNGLPMQFCFKDIYTTYSKGDAGNQVHTRSLHAEENAFLQLAKYGSPGIENGILFTTDQCCVLCAKKAYQLGIKTIFYIDPYTDIAPSHILRCPNPPIDDMPTLIHYEGAVGPAYSKLYVPFFSQKDEICCRLGVNMKELSASLSENKPQQGASKFQNYEDGPDGEKSTIINA